MDKKGMCCFTWIWLTICVFQHSSAYMYWSAFVETTYFDREINQTVRSECECGMYGTDSPLEVAEGRVVLPDSDPLACRANTTFTVTETPWIALIKRGNCTYSEKINAARVQGASAVVIYNVDRTGNGTQRMQHRGAVDIVAIMIGNLQGKEITNLIKSGTEVLMEIEVANPHGPWIDPLWVYVMSFTFFAVTAITLGYFTFLSIRRLCQAQEQRRQQKLLKSVAEKAIQKLKIRTLKRGDPEVGSEADGCAVCIDAYKQGDVVTVLDCRHLFHKTCIEPWLLDHRTCPMCKCDILKVEASSTPDVWFSINSMPDSRVVSQGVVALPGRDGQNREPAVQISPNADIKTEAHIYDNLAFVEEMQGAGRHDTRNQTA